MDGADVLGAPAPDLYAIRNEGLGQAIRATDGRCALAQVIRTIRSSRPDEVHAHAANPGSPGIPVIGAAGKFEDSSRLSRLLAQRLLWWIQGPVRYLTWASLSRSSECIVSAGQKVNMTGLALISDE